MTELTIRRSLMKTRILATGLLAILVLTACGRTGRLQSPGPHASSAPATAGDRLFVRDGSGGRGISILDVASRKRERVLPLGVPAPDWSALYTVDRAGGKTIVRAINVRTGQSVRETTIDGLYELPAPGLDGMPAGLTPNGRWLALHQVAGAQSGIMILDTSFRDSPKRVELNGSFYFDAIDDYATRLFLIEVPSPQQPTQYQVRAYDLTQGALQARPVIDKTAARPIMQGTRTSSVASRDGQWLYTLYVNAGRGAFIHALNVAQGFAQCIFLPRPERAGTDFAWSIAMTADGARLFAANGMTRSVVEIDLGTRTVRRKATLPGAAASRKATLPGAAASRNPLGQLVDLLAVRAEAKRLPGGGLALSPDGSTLFLADEAGLLAVSTADFTLRGRFLAGAALASLAVSPDSSRVYAVQETESQGLKLLQLDLLSGRVAEVEGALTPRSILRVEAK